MPFDPYLEKKILDAVLGQTALPAIGTVYVGLVLQCGTLSTGLTAGTAATSLACATNTAAYAGSSGDAILIGSGSTTQLVTASALWAAAATSISVNSFIPNATYAIGTPFIKVTYTTSIEPTGSSYARVAVTNNTTNWPNSTGGDPATKNNGVAVTFPTLSGAVATCAGWLVSDNATPGSGNILLVGALTTAQSFANGNTPSFGINALTATLT